MYKILEINKCDFETFFRLTNEESATEIECFEPANYEYNLKSFHFIQEGGVYDCLIYMEATVIENIKYDDDNYYEVLELNIRVGIGKFAKLKLNNDIYYVPMHMLKNIKELRKKERILLRRGYYHLLKVNGVINPAYYKTEEEIEKLPLLLEKAKKENDDFYIEYYTQILKDLED